MKRAAVFPNRGIGDALLMMIAAHRLKEVGYRVVVYHSAIHQMKRWFVGHEFEDLCPLDEFKEPFDLVIAQNDNSEKITKLLLLEKSGQIKKLSIFYPTHNPQKHHPLRFFDQVFNTRKTMAENIAKGVSLLVGTTTVSKNNGLVIPKELVHRRCEKRVVIHATSSQENKNWPMKCYAKIAEELEENGFHPVFVIHEGEKIHTGKFPSFICTNLDELSCFVYESGFMIGNDSLLGHLASNLVIPNLVIADDRKRMKLWRPGWLMGKVVTPPFWIPNLKYFRYKEQNWKQCVTPTKVLKIFKALV